VPFPKSIFLPFLESQVQIGIALTMRMRNHIHWHSIYRNGNVRSVIDIKTPQEYLFCFTSTGMLTYK
jgi:hypothetical protein